VIEKHLYRPGKTYGYGAARSDEALIARVEKLYRREILPRIAQGLSGSVYTQISDVEEETNGIVTYDRRVVKLPAERMQSVAEELRIQSTEGVVR
ncbi:MAG: glycoside hydrolase family 2, partial [Lachnospiraceae bacterium]|nr:glycoside hydrolase family 2 [Lachnospiraceae bacterium]